MKILSCVVVLLLLVSVSVSVAFAPRVVGTNESGQILREMPVLPAAYLAYVEKMRTSPPVKSHAPSRLREGVETIRYGVPGLFTSENIWRLCFAGLVSSILFGLVRFRHIPLWRYVWESFRRRYSHSGADHQPVPVR